MARKVQDDEAAAQFGQASTKEKKARHRAGKLVDKLPGHHKKAESLRITNDNLEEHRETILARGRKFKYPAQYSKRSVIIVSVVAAVVAVSAFSLWLNRALYKQQETGDFYYSVTKVLPLNVAVVDGQPVKYEDYLRRLRADIHYYLNREQRSFNSDEGRKELDYHKRKNLSVAEKAAYVDKIAEQKNISVSRDAVNAQIKQMREADGATEEELISTLQTYYGWTLDDFRSTIHDQLLEQKVAYEIDSDAKAKINKVEQRLKAGEDFATVAKAMSDDDASKANGGAISASANDQDPTGIVDVVKKLAVGQTSLVKQARVDNANYYYIAKLTAKDGDKIDYQIIMVKLNKLDKDFAQLNKQGKITEYIKVAKESEF